MKHNRHFADPRPHSLSMCKPLQPQRHTRLSNSLVKGKRNKKGKPEGRTKNNMKKGKQYEWQRKKN